MALSKIHYVMLKSGSKKHYVASGAHLGLPFVLFFTKGRAGGRPEGASVIGPLKGQEHNWWSLENLPAGASVGEGLRLLDKSMRAATIKISNQSPDRIPDMTATEAQTWVSGVVDKLVAGETGA